MIKQVQFQQIQKQNTLFIERQVFDMNNFLYLALVLCFVVFGEGNCCLRFSQDKCVQCPLEMHLFKGNCLFDIRNCESYKEGFECEKCEQGFSLGNNKCIQASSTMNPPSEKPVRQTNLQDRLSQTDQYKVVEINFRDLNGITDMNLLDEFWISDQIFKANNPQELKNAQIIRAEQRTYPNGTVHINIDYKGRRDQIYNATIMVNLKTFIFRVVAFRRFDEKTSNQSPSSTQQGKGQQQDANNQTSKMNQDSTKELNFTIIFNTYNQQFRFPQSAYLSRQVDFMNHTQLKLMTLLNQQGMAYLSQQTNTSPQNKVVKKSKLNHSSTSIHITDMHRADIRKYHDHNQSKEYLTIQYLTNDNEVLYLVVGQALTISSESNSVTPIQLVYAGFDQQTFLNKPHKTNTTQPQTSPANKNSTQNSQQMPSNSTNTSNNTIPLPPKPVQNSQEPLTSSQHEVLNKMEFILVEDDLQLLNDIYYLISKDELVRRFKEYKDMNPSKVFVASLSRSPQNSSNNKIQELKTANYYKLIYFKNENLSAQVIVRCDLITYKPQVQQIEQKTNESRNQFNPAQNESTQNQSQTDSDKNKNIPSDNSNTNELAPQSNVSEQTNSSSQLNSPSPSSPINKPSDTTSSQNISLFPIPTGFKMCNQSIHSNIFYLIAMDTLTNNDAKFFNVKPSYVYLKNQSNSVKIEFLFKFKISPKNGIQYIWAVFMDVFQSSFKAQIARKELIQTINQAESLNQQSDQTELLQKEDLINKAPLPNRPKVSGKVVLLREEKFRILLQQSRQNNNQLRFSP